jgi:hypothetical protein
VERCLACEADRSGTLVGRRSQKAVFFTRESAKTVGVMF